MARVFRDRKEAKEYLSAHAQCVVCTVTYSIDQALGKHECWQHPGQIDTARDIFVCCGTSARGATTPAEFYALFPDPEDCGCIPCDHRPTPYPFTKTDGIVIFMSEYRDILGDRRAAVVDPGTGCVAIRQYDKECTTATALAMRKFARAGRVPSPPLSPRHAFVIAELNRRARDSRRTATRKRVTFA